MKTIIRKMSSRACSGGRGDPVSARGIAALRFTTLAMTLICFLSCANAGKAMKEVTILTQNPSQKIVVKTEVADTDALRMQGLMFRKDLGKNEGMIFLFPADSHTAFWMHNTYIPLDILFINKDHQIVDIAENAQPLSDDLIQPLHSYRYTLEVNGGFSKAHKIQVGDRVEF